ncbi:cyclophilin-like fold protein [Flavobacterium sp. GB2R13]|uniref:cyclophilin-like fold protein n=1 Tax=Flavobacterium algoris TaxID=3398733 RepID=UPI003A881F45
MKYVVATVLMLVSFTLCLASYHKDDEATPTQNNSNNNGNPNNPTSNKMKITAGTSVFTATLNDTATAASFKTMLPLTLNMNKLNRNEKFYFFSTTLPTNASTGSNIQTGDLMLYSNNCLVLFYENLNTSYSYTRLGKIDNIIGLVSALGTGSITVKFELE